MSSLLVLLEVEKRFLHERFAEILNIICETRGRFEASTSTAEMRQQTFELHSVLFSLSTLDTQTVGFQWVNC
jgi:hypothetical protein